MKPAWLEIAYKYEGTREYPGAASNPVILYFWKLARLSGIKDDRVPWCSGFACAMMEEAGIRSPRSDGARSWIDWGQVKSTPEVGDVVVLKRPGGFHVGFAVGRDTRGNVMLIGGNQGDKVCVAAFPADRILAIRRPIGQASGGPLPLMAAVPLSSSEA